MVSKQTAQLECFGFSMNNEILTTYSKSEGEAAVAIEIQRLDG